MIKLQIAILMIVAIYTTTSAQESRYGLRLGVNLSSISSDDIGEGLDESRIGVAAGFFAEYFLTQKLTIQPELQYSSQGNKSKTLRVNYIQLPVLFKYSIFRDVVNLQLGPQAGVKIWEWERNQNYNTFDFAGVIGLGVNFTDNFFATVRYAHSITNVFDDSDLPISVEGNNTNIQLSVGYRL